MDEQTTVEAPRRGRPRRGRPRTEVTDVGQQILDRVARVSGAIDSTTEQLTALHQQRTQLYAEGVRAGVTKSALATAAGCDMTAVIHALKKAGL